MLAVAAAEPRLTEIGWILDYLPDLEADFRAFYRVDDMLALPGPEFCRLASRTVAYAGVMQARAQALQSADSAGAGREASTRRARTGKDVTRASVAVAGLGDIISFGNSQ